MKKLLILLFVFAYSQTEAMTAPPILTKAGNASDTAVNYAKKTYFVLATDKKGIPATAVTILSMVKQATASLIIKVFLLEQPTTLEKLQLFYCREYEGIQHSIRAYTIPKREKGLLNKLASDSNIWHPLTYFKIFAPRLFFEVDPTIDSCVWLDNDLLFKRSPTEILSYFPDMKGRGRSYAGTCYSTTFRLQHEVELPTTNCGCSDNRL